MLFPLIFGLDKSPSTVSSLRPVGLEIFRRRGLITDQTGLAFVLYDWLINLDEEIRCFWNIRKDRRPTAAAVFYVLLRYPPIIYEFLGVPTLFPMTETVRPLDCFPDRGCRILTRMRFKAYVAYGMLRRPLAY